MIRAKMQCTGVTGGPTTGFENVTLSAVYSPDRSDPNYEWSQATPSANLTMSISNPSAFGKFVQGQTYHVDFTPAE